MSTLFQYRDAIEIFIRHNDDSSYPFAAEHDILYGPESPPADSVDGEALDELGWRWDDDVNCWAIFT